MSTLSEGELHVQAMRLVCESLADREKTGLEVDWDVINQQLDHMDVILQGIADQRVDDADEIKTLRKQLAEQQAETVDVRRQRNNETDRLNATNAVSVQQRDEIAYLRARLDEERSVSAGLRQQLDAAQAAVTLQRAGIDRLHKFVGAVRLAMWPEDIKSALTELDAGSIQPTPVAERCPECDGSGMVDSGGFTPDGKGINVPCGGNCRGNPCPSQPTPVAEPLDAEEDTCPGT